VLVIIPDFVVIQLFIAQNGIQCADVPLRISNSRNLQFFTGSIACSASRWYLVYSEADFEVFRPAGATRCTDGGEIWLGGGDL